MKRDDIMQGLRLAVDALLRAQCKRVWINGSFVTSKASPSDWDGCWDPSGVDPTLLDPVLLDFSPAGRQRMKVKYMGDVFPSSVIEASSGLLFVDYFQVDKASGDPKGIVLIDLTGSSP